MSRRDRSHVVWWFIIAGCIAGVVTMSALAMWAAYSIGEP